MAPYIIADDFSLQLLLQTAVTAAVEREYAPLPGGYPPCKSLNFSLFHEGERERRLGFLEP